MHGNTLEFDTGASDNTVNKQVLLQNKYQDKYLSVT